MTFIARRCKLALAVTTALACTLPSSAQAQAASTAAAQRHQFDIAAQPLAGALRAFARITGRQVLFDGSIVRGKQTGGVRGSMDAGRAMDALLAGSGLIATRTTRGAYVIKTPLVVAVTEDAASAAGDVEDSDDTIIVTGLRLSLDASLQQKRRETAATDTIQAEDIGKFPDSNVAESMQRIPGVALSRGDGGEGRNISIRGLGPTFSRVRINGMEGTAQTGASDAFGAGNYGRSFDFNIFPSEIFQSLTVRKTPTADMEEGSLGATVDLQAPKPFDLPRGQLVSLSARGVYNEVSQSFDPRLSVLAGKTFADGTLGVLGAFSYTRRHQREVGYSAVDIRRGSDDAGFCSPIGFAPQNPGNNATKGVTAANCTVNNPRTGNAAAYQEMLDLRGVANTPGGGAFFPRQPRYVNSETDYERLGGTLSLQWRPSDRTSLLLNGLYSRFDVSRVDSIISGLSFGRNLNDNGKPGTSIRDIEFDRNGSLVYGLFDGVDVRSETLLDEYVSTFEQVNAQFEHRFTDAFGITAMAGVSRSVFSNPTRLTVNIDAVDADGFAVDFRDNPYAPAITYGIDVANVANFGYQPRNANGTVQGNFGTRNSRAETVNQTYELNADWTVSDGFILKVGGQYRQSQFKSRYLGVSPNITNTPALAAGQTLAGVTRQVTGYDDLAGSGAPAGWVAIDHERWKQSVGFDSFALCGTECGNALSELRERIKGAYLMVAFDTKGRLPLPIRGDFGVRYVATQQRSIGTTPQAAPAGSLFPNVAVIATVDTDYEDWLPAANVVLDLTPKLLVRLSAARVMARADLESLTAGGTINPTTRSATINNPFLDPIRADTFDAALEYYYAPGALLSVAYFRKNISSFIQTIQTNTPFAQLGLPESLLTNTTARPTDEFTVRRLANTPGGPLNGIELNVQAPLSFLPGFLGNFGVLANFTHVTSDINYILESAGGVVIRSTQADLVNLSKNTASGSLYYEDARFSIRATGSFRDSYLRRVPASAPDSDASGTNESFFLDASASFTVNPRIKVFLDAQNLTDEHNRSFVDTVRQDPTLDTRFGRAFTLGVNVRL